MTCGEDHDPTIIGAHLDVFISYAHKDEKLRQALDNHLALLRSHRLINAWHDRQIRQGLREAKGAEAHRSAGRWPSRQRRAPAPE